MTEPAALLQFLTEVENDVTSDVQPFAGNPADFREQAFSKMLSDELETAGILESPSICHFERGRSSSSFKVSGYGVPDDDNRLDLFVTVYEPGPHNDVPSINATDIDAAFNKLERFLGQALNGILTSIDPALPEYYMVERIHQLKSRFDRVNLLLLTNARMAVRRERQRKASVHGLTASYDIWDIERFRRLRESGASYEALSVDLRSEPEGGLPCVRLDTDDHGFRTCIAIFPGTLLCSLYDEYGSRVLELNVRSYLQAKGKVNKGILETLRTDPADFMAFNNGITVVAEKVVFGLLKNGQPGIQELVGMQIVNGGQTTASIHRASKEFGADLSKVHVQGKIVTVDPERFNAVVPMISRYSNTQNKVSEPDLQANHPFHIGVERVSRREWSPDQTSKWFYERARGSYQTARSREGSTEARRREFDKKFPSSQRLTKEDLARFENCWRGLPQIVNRGGQKNFTHFMTLIKDELGLLPDSWEPSTDDFRRRIAKAILFRDIQRLVRSDESISSYRINVTNYTVSLIADKTARRVDLDHIWKMQKITGATAELASSWAKVLHRSLLEFAQRQGAHIDNVLKSQACWDHMLSLNLAIPVAIERELLTTGSQPGLFVGSNIDRYGNTLSNQDHNNVARCMELNAEQWMSVVTWGNGPGEFERLKLGVATTLASYAAQGWKRSPSPKQAKHGAAMIEAAKTAGILRI